MNREIKNYVCPYCGETHYSSEGLKGHVFKAHKGRGLPTAKCRIKLIINRA